MEYLPVGSYVLAETQTPEGYATADPILIEIPDKGHMVSVGQWSMKDEPLKLSVSKRVNFRRERGGRSGAFHLSGIRRWKDIQ